MKRVLLIIGILIAMASCENGGDKPVQTAPKAARKTVTVPDFVGDSAYYFVKKQCDFGP